VYRGVAVVTQDERDELIARINDLQKEMAQHMANDRSIPLLDSSLTMQQFKLLLILSVDQGLSIHQAAERLGVKIGTVTGIVDRLVSQRLVRRTEDSQDRRVRRISLTAKGTRVQEELTDTGLSRFRLLLAELDDETLRQCLHVTRALLDASVRLRGT
ncbi:MAG: MarR family winged helix-turn-helix transcriptional regulator, partial [Stackebrandtia sp.]